MRTFVTRCAVGEFVTDGEGNGKKISKKRAAEKMLDKLKVFALCRLCIFASTNLEIKEVKVMYFFSTRKGLNLMSDELTATGRIFA